MKNGFIFLSLLVVGWLSAVALIQQAKGFSLGQVERLHRANF